VGESCDRECFLNRDRSSFELREGKPDSLPLLVFGRWVSRGEQGSANEMRAEEPFPAFDLVL
jgi:hypothetical protein